MLSLSHERKKILIKNVFPLSLTFFLVSLKIFLGERLEWVWNVLWKSFFFLCSIKHSTHFLIRAWSFDKGFWYVIFYLSMKMRGKFGIFITVLAEKRKFRKFSTEISAYRLQYKDWTTYSLEVKPQTNLFSTSSHADSLKSLISHSISQFLVELSSIKL